jgi:hypothetical protein
MKLASLFEKTIAEVNQSPANLAAFANSPAVEGMTVGFETELAVPMDEDIDEPEMIPDYSADPRVGDIDDVVEFFTSGEFGLSRREGIALHDRLSEDYLDWLNGKVMDEFDRHGEDRIRAKAKSDGLDDDEIEDMIANETREYKNYQESVTDDIREEIAEGESDYEQFFRSEGLRRMSDIETRYDVTWPHVTYEEKGSAGLDEVAKEIQASLGIKIFTSSGYHAAPRIPGAWVLEPDSSIESPQGYSGLELITPSPPFSVSEAWYWIDQVFTWASRYGCETNDSTGFHMNVGLPSKTTQDLDWIKLVLFLGDKHVLELFDRQANTYAASALDMLINHVSQMENFPTDAAFKSMRSGLMNIASKQIGKPQTGKYTSVNMKDKYIEFRSAGGDYLDRKDNIQNTMLRYVQAVAIAADPELYKQEYAKKLYKLFSKLRKGKTSDYVINLFSSYNAGLFDKSVLKQSLAQLRTTIDQENKD